MFWEANRLRRKRPQQLRARASDEVQQAGQIHNRATNGVENEVRGTLLMVQWGLVANSFACLSSPFSLSSPSWASSFPKRSTSRDNPVRSALFATRNNVSETRAVAPRMKRCCSSGSAAFEADRKSVV